MSWPAVAWALAQRTPSSAAKFLLTVIADSASVGDWLAWPSVAYLSEITQQDRKTVLKNVKALVEAKLILPTGKTGKTGQVTVWQLPIPEPSKSPKFGTDKKAAKGPKNGTGEAPPKRPKTGTVPDAETVPIFPGKSPNFPAKESQNWDTEPVKNQLRTKERAGNTRSTVSADDLVRDGLEVELAAEFLAHREALKKPLTPRAWSDLKSEASKATWSIRDAVEKVLARGWISFQASYVQDRGNSQTAASKPQVMGKPWEGAH